MLRQVKWFDNSRAYVFIGRRDGPDVFVCYTTITGEGFRTLKEGDSVEFEILKALKGPQAANVIKIPVNSKDHQAARKLSKGHGPHWR